MAGARIAVCVELGKRRAFASALGWPGWARGGRDEAAALEALAAYAPRYAPVAAAAGFPLPAGGGARLEVVERVEGNASTDFGVPALPAAADREAISAAEADRLARLVDAAWEAFSSAVAAAPAELRRGPRGGGRDRDKVAAHVVEAEVAYAPRLGIRARSHPPSDTAATRRLRQEMLAAIRGAREGVPEKPSGGPGWPIPYAARRIAWHALDHAWEIEDRSLPG